MISIALHKYGINIFFLNTNLKAKVLKNKL